MMRPEAPSSSTIKTGSYKPWEINPELVRLGAIRDYMLRSGDLARTSQNQQIYTGILKAFRKQGLDTTPMIDAFEEIARLSPDLMGMSRTEMLALLSPPKLVIPGIGRMDAPFQGEEKPGFFSGLWQKITGSSNQDQRVQQ